MLIRSILSRCSMMKVQTNLTMCGAWMKNGDPAFPVTRGIIDNNGEESELLFFNYKRADCDGPRASLGLYPRDMLDRMEANDAVYLNRCIWPCSDHHLIKNVFPVVRWPCESGTSRKGKCSRCPKTSPNCWKELDFRSKRKVLKDLAVSSHRSYPIDLPNDFKNTPKRFW